MHLSLFGAAEEQASQLLPLLSWLSSPVLVKLAPNHAQLLVHPPPRHALSSACLAFSLPLPTSTALSMDTLFLPQPL